ncbi:MAG: zinc metalloprotease HtpX [Cellulomonadaceae bacterium]|jgi:heat shock protein HtpX|nr:zinc metalloprotease HtpX [Cellulomonadaceae bacterium]
MYGRKHYNGLKTTMLFVVMWTIIMLLGFFVGGGDSTMLILFTGIGLVMTFVGYWNSATIAIRSMKAYPVTEEMAPAIYRIVRELSTKAGQPMPSIYISPTASPNAFATGRNPQNAAVCCTEGILRLLDERELRGVLGHELMHVYNRDILTSAVASAMAGVITSLARFLMFFGGGNRRNNSSALAGLAAMILMPIAASLIQLAISRTREYDADEDGARLTEDPLALASALQKLESGISLAPLPAEPQLQNVSNMMIANPFRSGGSMSRLFSTHPPMADRIARLQAQAGLVLPPM